MGYLDPGLFGMLSQVGLVVFLVVVSALTFLFKPIKKGFMRIFKSKKLKSPQPTPDDSDVIINHTEPD